jgi:hypothetical protein
MERRKTAIVASIRKYVSQVSAINATLPNRSDQAIPVMIAPRSTSALSISRCSNVESPLQPKVGRPTTMTTTMMRTAYAGGELRAIDAK